MVPARLLSRALGRVPGLRRLPMLKLLAIAEIAVVARSHVTKLDAAERRRFLHLLHEGRGRRRNLTAAQRDEFARLLAKLEPRLFAGVVADKLSPVPLPRRLVEGPRNRRVAA